MPEHCGNNQEMNRLLERAKKSPSRVNGSIARSRTWGGALLVATVLLAGCREGTERDPPSPVGLEAGQPCAHSSDCRMGLVCDASRQICVCTSHEACPEGTFCHPYTGRCVFEEPGCTGDADCPSGSYCDPEARRCRPGAGYCEPCTRDAECAERGARCLPTGTCGKPCSLERDCGPRARCQGGQCVPSLRCYETDGRPTGRCVDACTVDADCQGEGERCELGLCLPPIGCEDIEACVPDTLYPCERNADCVHGVDQVCELGKCVARNSGCRFSEACDPVLLSCVPACREDADCRPGRICRAGACFPQYRCQSNRHADCPRGMVCACPRGRSCSSPGEGACVPECRSNGDCPPRHVCAERFGRRLCEPGCASDRDCGPKERCGPDGLCTSDPLSCRFTELCPACTFCVEGACRPGEAPYCQPCDGDSDCGPGGVCLARRCAPACGAEGCPSGFECKAEGERRVCRPLDGICDTECT